MNPSTCDVTPPEKFHLCPMYLYGQLNRWAGPTVLSLLLLMMRAVYGYGFFVAGKGKLMDISKPIAFFTQLHIPMPVANAWLVACVECFGGLLLLTGQFSRPISIVLTINMLVAYITADPDALKKLWNDSDPTAVFNAAPFWFMATTVFVLACGPGWFSLDALLGKLFFNRPCNHARQTVVES